MYGVVVPVKPPGVAKTRLAALGDAARRQLCAAFALDTIEMVQTCQRVGRVLVVTDDLGVANAAQDLGARVVPDGVSGDLNRSLELGAAELHRTDPTLGLVALFADIPALRADELDAALSSACEPTSFVADADGCGTTMMASRDLLSFRPRFGPASRRAFLDGGAQELLDDLPGLRRDVDTPAHLAAAVALGVGPRTSYVVTAHRL